MEMMLTRLIKTKCDAYVSNFDFGLSVTYNRSKIGECVQRILKGDFVPSEATDIALNTMGCMWNATYMVDKHSVSVTFLQSKGSKSRVIRVLHFLNRILQVIDALNPYTSNQPLQLYLFDLDFPKVYQKGEIPSPKHVNTGVRYDNIVIVYRREEMGKVLIHELLHRFGFEMVFNKEHDKQIRQIKRFFSVEDIVLNEAYVDALAMVMNTSFYATMMKRPFESLWVKELKHIMKQAACLSAIYQEEFKGRKIVEKTNGLSYYVIKAMILMGVGLTGVTRASWIVHSGQSFDKQKRTISSLLKHIIDGFKPCSEFWKYYRTLSKTPCRHGSSLRMSTLDCI